jgi:two-component system, OmpR family, sensor histidine kinase RstB
VAQGLTTVNKLFIRMFGGLLLTLTVVSLFCTFLYSTVNVVRSEHYRVSISSPTLNWLAGLDAVELASRVSGLSESSALTPDLTQISIEPVSRFHFSSVDLERLSYGQVLVTSEDHGYRAIRALDVNNGEGNSDEEPRFVVVWFADLYSGSNQLLGGLILEQLNAKLLQQVQGIDEVYLSELMQAFNVSITSVADEGGGLPLGVLAQLSASGRYFYSGADGSSSIGYYRLDNGAVFRIGFPEPYSSVSYVLIFTLVLMVIAAVAAAVYVLISSIDKRLRGLEAVASRISRGELDARINVDRQDAIGRLGNAFNRMAEHIQRLVGVQREMIHAVSHELRTPVARIRFGVQMIEDCSSEKSLQKQLTGIDSDIQELDELIDEILTYARLEQGGPILVFNDVDVKLIVEQVVSEQSSVKPEMTIQAEFEEGAQQWKQSDVEYRYIHRAVQNLVGNATRYASSTVKVRCAFDKDTCRIDVEDDGAGIPESDWEKVFTPFARLDDSRTRSSGGYGLGLSIVRRILYWHGGQAFLGRSSMGGAKFSLVWPRRQLDD